MRCFSNLLVFSVVYLVIGLSANVFAEDVEDKRLLSKLDVDVSGSFDLCSKYVWRGFTLDTDPVLQPAFNFSGHGFTFSFWSSWDLDNSDSLNGDEIDYVIDYTEEFKDVSISTGHTYYEFPGTDTFSRELYGSISLSAIPLTPTFTYYYDYGDEEQGGADGQYMTLEVSHSFMVEEDLGITLDFSGRAGYNKELFINGEGGDVLLSAGLTVPLTKGLSLSPRVNYAMPYGDLDDSNDGNQRDRFYYGFSLSCVF